MTDDVSGVAGTTEDEREARLAALLSVDIDTAPARTELAGTDIAGTDIAGTDIAGTDIAAADEAASPDPEVDREADAGESRSRTGRWSWVALAVLMVAGCGLVYGGTRLIRASTEGEVLAPIVDPTEPGFEALVDPSPTLVLMHDVDGALDSITVLSLASPDGGGGGVLLVPRRTITQLPLEDERPVGSAYEATTPTSEADAVGFLVGSGVQELAVVDDARWADLVGPVAPITIDNPNELRVDDEVRFAAGAIDLAAEDVGPYLRSTVEGESDLARLFRHQTFWNAWLDGVAVDGSDAAVPGELDSGVGRFVRSLARDGNEIETLPVQPSTAERFGDEPTFVPRAAELRALIDRLIPLPVSPGPGIRARLRVLNGTTDTSKAMSVAGMLPPAGVEVTLVGNAGNLDVVATTIEYTGDEFQDEAEAVAEILGIDVGAVVEDTRPSDAVDITVTLGADHV